MRSNKKITITSVLPHDKEHLFKWINNSEVINLSAPYKPIHWVDHCRWFENLGSDPSRMFFVIRKSEDKEAIGTIQLISIHSINRSAEIVVRIGDQINRGQGFGTEALELVLKYAWNDLNLNRVYLNVFARNKPAIRSYKKCGFLQEGCLRKAVYINGAWDDILILAILRK